MILQALYNYYEILRQDPDTEIAEPGYSSAQVSYALNLSREGDLLEVIPLFEYVPRGKRMVERPRRMNVPEQVKRSSNIKANFLCDNATYVLGLSDKGPDHASPRWESFRDLNLEILSTVDSPISRAIAAFLQKYDPQQAEHHPVLAQHLEDLKKSQGNLIFYVEGETALEDPQIKRAWEKYLLGAEETMLSQCLVTGEVEPIARLHPAIKGIRGAQPTGASLVSFNLDAFRSYGKEKGDNSPVSQRVASGYGIALNYLISNQNPNPPIYVGDARVVYWAESRDKRYASAFYALLNPEYFEGAGESLENTRQRAREVERTIGEIWGKIEQGKPLDIAPLRETLDENTRFYVLGVAPNAGRLAVRFFFTERFGVFAERIMQHYQDLRIVKEFENQPSYLSPYRILAECVSSKVNQRDEEISKTWSLLGGTLLRSILTGAPYPEGLYAAILNRVRHDTDRVNYVRAAYIKAHLIRKYRRQGSNPYKEALEMSLNESYTHPAYVLGRLFAWLERAQREAIGSNINATIKDRFFASACATPASVFPLLLRLSSHWVGRAEYGRYLDENVQELLNLLPAEPFPAHFNLEEQGIFMLGYYHQRAAFYTKGSNSKTD